MPDQDASPATRGDHRKLERTKHAGIYRRHAADCDRRKPCNCQYVVRWKYRGKSHKRYFRTLAVAREFKGNTDAGDGVVR